MGIVTELSVTNRGIRCNYAQDAVASDEFAKYSDLPDGQNFRRNSIAKSTATSATLERSVFYPELACTRLRENDSTFWSLSPTGSLTAPRTKHQQTKETGEFRDRAIQQPHRQPRHGARSMGTGERASGQLPDTNVDDTSNHTKVHISPHAYVFLQNVTPPSDRKQKYSA